jgi:dipeptidyl aminopeptidase/acylaminoacyl peptidase
MVAWIAGNWTKPWKCLVNHDGVFDIRLMSYSTELKPQNSVQWYATVEAWMKRWLDH